MYLRTRNSDHLMAAKEPAIAPASPAPRAVRIIAIMEKGGFKDTYEINLPKEATVPDIKKWAERDHNANPMATKVYVPNDLGDELPDNVDEVDKDDLKLLHGHLKLPRDAKWVYVHIGAVKEPATAAAAGAGAGGGAEVKFTEEHAFEAVLHFVTKRVPNGDKAQQMTGGVKLPWRYVNVLREVQCDLDLKPSDMATLKKKQIANHALKEATKRKLEEAEVDFEGFVAEVIESKRARASHGRSS